MKIKKPIFIIGAGRSGTTVFYNHLAIHPELCWFSNITDRHYNIFKVPFIHRILDFPIIGKRVQRKIINRERTLIKPVEAEAIYHQFCNFSKSQKSTELDYKSQQVDRFKKVISEHLTLSGKKRFLTKQTANTQRLRLINEIFPDAYYIHLIRDGRAVANSLYNINWWSEIELWWCDGIKTKEWDGSQIELCGLHWKHNVAEILSNKHLFEDRYIEINYESFEDNFREVMTEVIEFCDLSVKEKYIDKLPKTLPTTNYKWKNDLSKEQQEILNNILEKLLQNLGYL